MRRFSFHIHLVRMRKFQWARFAIVLCVAGSSQQVLAGVLKWRSEAELMRNGGQIEIGLVSEVNSVRPGETLTLGLQIQQEPDWHTYWKSPGIVGVPTSLKWQLPPGFSAGEIQWPVPERVKMTVITAYGYKTTQPLLLIDIEVPEELEGDPDEITIRADGAWMTCERTCHPGYGTFSITLPVSASDEPDWDTEWHPRFERERARHPEALAGWDASLNRPDEDTILLTLKPDGEGASLVPGDEVQVFSEDLQVDSDEPQEVRILGDGSVEVRLAHCRFGPDSPTEFSALVFTSGIWSESQGQWGRIQVAWEEDSAKGNLEP